MKSARGRYFRTVRTLVQGKLYLMAQRITTTSRFFLTSMTRSLISTRPPQPVVDEREGALDLLLADPEKHFFSVRTPDQSVSALDRTLLLCV